jgi:hypothetical protein
MATASCHFNTGYLSAHAEDMILEGRAARIMTTPINLDDFDLLTTLKRTRIQPQST